MVYMIFNDSCFLSLDTEVRVTIVIFNEQICLNIYKNILDINMITFNYLVFKILLIIKYILDEYKIHT
jgi:hypothetical protein